MEAKELGELLKDNGLIDESLLVFEVQYRLSGYYGGIKGRFLRAETPHRPSMKCWKSWRASTPKDSRLRNNARLQNKRNLT